MAGKTFYDVLGVKRDATQDEIKVAFHRLAAKYHPDAGGDEKKFAEINEAYTTLSDEQRRKEYDQMLLFGGIPGAEFGGSGGRNRGYSYTSGMGGVDFQDLFENMRSGDGSFGGFDFSTLFGGTAGQRGQSRSTRGRDLVVDIRLTAEEALSGVEKRVTFTDPTTGEQRTRTIKVPAGAYDGMKLRKRGQGEPGTNGGANGDFVVTTKVAEHPLFKRDGADVRMEVPISVWEAALGAEVDVPAPDGTMCRVKIPAGTQDGKTFRYRGHGAPQVKRKDNSRGSLFVTVRVKVPTRLTAKEREQMEALRDADTRAYREDVESYAS